jgi:hypothetical protein
MAYYGYLTQLNISRPVMYTTTSAVSIPIQWTGFAVVVALLALYLAMVVVATMFFLAKSDLSQLGNAWQAVAQIVSNDMVDTLRPAANTTDKDVQTLLDRGGSGGKAELIL